MSARRIEIETLHAVIAVGRVEDPPDGVFCLINRGVRDVDGVPTIDFEMEVFVRTKRLSPELRRAVREELERTAKLPRLAPETEVEMAAMQKENP
jgi:hypothetical protein